MSHPMQNSDLEARSIPRASILIIDKDEKVLATYAEAIEVEGHVVFTAPSWEVAEPIIRQHTIDLILIANTLDDGNASTVIPLIKRISSRIRIIVLCDKNDTSCRRKLLQTLPIQGCHEKEEDVSRLFLWIDVILKSLTKLDMIRQQLGTIKSQIKIIEKNKEGLRYIISAMPETINRLQPLDKFIRGILIQLNGFIESDNSFLATVDENEQLILLVGTGAYDLDEKSFLQSNEVAGHMGAIDEVRTRGESVIKNNEVYIPLKAKDKVIGLFYLEKPGPGLKELEVEMLRLFASHAAITIENSNLFKLATLDGLTGLYVRRYFLQRFQEVLQFSSRFGGQAISLVMFDIDHFKYVNDTFGHQDGDTVLSEVASIILQNIRSTDVAGRLGGEEFVVLLIDTPLEEAQVIAEEIRAKVETREFILQGKKHPVTISSGISNIPLYVVSTELLGEKKITDIAMHDVRKMLSVADKALYASKENGRNRVTVSEPLVPGP